MLLCADPRWGRGHETAGEDVSPASPLPSWPACGAGEPLALPPPAAVQLWPCGCWLTIDDRCPQPYLAAEYVAHFVSGMQGDEADPLYDGKWAKAIATCKHYGATTPRHFCLASCSCWLWMQYE